MGLTGCTVVRSCLRKLPVSNTTHLQEAPSDQPPIRAFSNRDTQWAGGYRIYRTDLNTRWPHPLSASAGPQISGSTMAPHRAVGSGPSTPGSGLGLVAALRVWAYEGGRGGGGVRVRSTRDRPSAGWRRVAPGNRPLRAEWCAVDLVLWAQVSTLSRTANGRHTTSALLHARG